jgi:acyl carrier protein
MKNAMHKDLIRNFIYSSLTKRSEHKKIADKDNIIKEGILDSLGLMHLINYIEETFSLKIDDEELIPDNFETVEVISSLIGRLIESEK